MRFHDSLAAKMDELIGQRETAQKKLSGVIMQLPDFVAMKSIESALSAHVEAARLVAGAGAGDQVRKVDGGWEFVEAAPAATQQSGYGEE